MLASVARKASKVVVLPAGAATRRRHGDVVILLYHRVGDGPGEIELPADVFEAQLQHLAMTGHVRSLDEALGDDRGGVVLTFDDGTPDFASTVVPLLVRYALPATLYLATAVADGPDGLTWRELADARATGLVTVGSHTHSHADLSKADVATCEEEMRCSKELIEDRLGVACRHFAYPWAVGSAVADAVARRTFDTAALEAWRTNRRGRTDPWRLGRTPVLRSDGLAFFRAKTAGLLDGEALLYRALRRGPWRRT
jgi:peptidoglycan/xylan/chitin deacetylase (PgdA/CDA1 family)